MTVIYMTIVNFVRCRICLQLDNTRSPPDRHVVPRLFNVKKLTRAITNNAEHAQKQKYNKQKTTWELWVNNT